MKSKSITENKEATVYCYYYASSEKLKEHLKIFLKAYNFAKQLKTLKVS